MAEREGWNDRRWSCFTIHRIAGATTAGCRLLPRRTDQLAMGGIGTRATACMAGYILTDKQIVVSLMHAQKELRPPLKSASPRFEVLVRSHKGLIKQSPIIYDMRTNCQSFNARFCNISLNRIKHSDPSIFGARVRWFSMGYRSSFFQ